MMFKKYEKGGYKPMENPPKIHTSQIPIETAFDGCAKGCSYIKLSDFPPVLVLGKAFIRHCEHKSFCEDMAKHLSQFVEESEDTQ